MSDYKSLDKIVEQIAFYINQLNSGKLAATEIDALLHEVQQLQERLIILRYKAFEATAVLDEPKEDTPTTIETPISFSIHASATPSSVVAESPKQVSLIDVINEALQNTPEATSDLSAVLQQASATAKEVKQEIEVVTVEAQLELEEPELVQQEVEVPNLVQSAPAAKAAADEVPLAERLQKSAIGDLGKAIPLAQKFVFINQLFNQNSDDYHSSIEQLNNFEEMEEAMTFIKSNLMPLYKWNQEDKNVELFIDLVERRFL